MSPIELFGNFSFPNNFLIKQQNTQYFAGLVRQLTELSNKSINAGMYSFFRIYTPAKHLGFLIELFGNFN